MKKLYVLGIVLIVMFSFVGCATTEVEEEKVETVAPAPVEEQPVAEEPVAEEVEADTTAVAEDASTVYVEEAARQLKKRI